MSGIRHATITDLEGVFDLTRNFATTFRPDFVASRNRFTV